MIYNSATQSLVLFLTNNTMVSYDLKSPDTPYRIANIPLFYEMEYLVHKRTRKVIAKNLDDGFYLMAKDKNNEVIYAYYQLGVPVHQS